MIVRLAVEIAGRHGFVDETGALVVPATFDDVGTFAEGRFPFETGVVATAYGTDHTAATWGWADAAGKVVIPPTWLAGYAFSEGRAQAKCADGHWTYLDPDGRQVVTCTLWRTTPYHDGRAVAEIRQDVWAILDRDGKVVLQLPPEADCSDPPSYSDGLLALDVGSGTRYLDLAGATVFEIPGRGSDFSEGLAAFRAEDGRTGWRRKDGTVAIPATFAWGGRFADGRAVVEIDGKRGYIDAEGKVAIPARFSWASPFREGLAWVSEDGTRYGYIDPTGHPVLPAKYRDPEDARSSFHGGFAKVKLEDDRRVWIDRTGRVVAPAAR